MLGSKETIDLRYDTKYAKRQDEKLDKILVALNTIIDQLDRIGSRGMM